MRVVREHRDDLISRVRILSAVVTGLLVVLAAGFWFVQLVQGEYFRELAENNRLRKLPIKAPRGLIYDRNGRLLVENIPSYNLMFDRSRAHDIDYSLRFASEVLGRPLPDVHEVMARYAGTPVFRPVLLAENLSLSEVSRFGVAGLEYPEFEVEVQHLRLYRHGAQTAAVLGYLGEVTQAEVERSNGLYEPGDLVGKKGIEQTYDSELRGKDGERVVVVDSRGELLEEYGSQPAIPGKNLTLSIDLDLQQEAAHQLEGPEKVGAVVAMDPRTGEILAMVSSPSYNPNLFARRLQKNDWQALLDDPYHPLQNRVIQNTYSPGSTFKMVMATAGLTEHLVDENSRVFCSGSAVFYGRAFRCWKKGGHGSVDAHHAIKGSCDVYLHHRPAPGDRPHRQIFAAVRHRHTDRDRGPGREAGAGAGHGLEPQDAQDALVSGRDDLRLHRPGTGPDDAAPDDRAHRHGRQRRLPRHAAPGQKRPRAAAAARGSRCQGARSGAPRDVGGGQRAGRHGLQLGAVGRREHRRQVRHRAGHRPGAAHRLQGSPFQVP